MLLPSFPGNAQTLDPAQIDQLVQEHFKTSGPGVAVLVAQKDKILYHKAFGMAHIELGVPLRSDHVLRIGSVSKQFTAAAILRLAEQGKLSLQDDLRKFVPDYPTQGKTITVEHLLTHSSGIKSYTDMPQWDEQTHRKDFSPTALIDFFKNEPMDFEPGTRYAYNNSAYVLLGHIIEKTSGKTYGDYISTEFFGPLGMTNSYYGDTQPIIRNRAAGYTAAETAGQYANAAFLSMTQPYAAGSLLSTVEDLYRWTRALHGGKLLKPESFRQMTTPYRLADGSSTHYGYGLQLGNLLGSPTVEHSGGIHGFLSALLYLPQEEICVSILTNCDCQPPGEIAARIATLVAGKTYQPSPISLKTSDLERYVGVYENTAKEQRYITLEGGQLYSKRQGGSRFKLQPYGPDQFFFENSFARIQFLRDKKDGQKVLSANVSDRNSTDNRWEKTDKPLPEAIQKLQLTEAQLEPFVGEYMLVPGFNITVTREGTRLFCQATGQQRFEVYAKAPTRFFLKVVEAEIEFYPDEKGYTPRMILFQNGQELVGNRVK
jgi:CubicO group peptidase (beta-lactamase class C family)